MVALIVAGWPGRELSEATVQIWATAYDESGESFADLDAAVRTTLASPEAVFIPHPGRLIGMARANRRAREGAVRALPPAPDSRALTWSSIRELRPDMAARWDAVKSRHPSFAGKRWSRDAAIEDEGRESGGGDPARSWPT